MMYEETAPLLSNRSSELLPPRDVYDRFSSLQKKVIVGVTSIAGVIPPLATASFVPCVPQIAEDLETSGSVVNYTVGIYLFTMAAGTLVWGRYSEFYGRQPVYLTSLPLLVLGSLCVSLSNNVGQLAIGRTIQAFGASSVISVGPATISDMYRLEERGMPMGIFSGTVPVGSAVGPFAGGLAATYASWRTMQLIIFFMALVIFIFALFLPETSHPGTRGLDKIIERVAGDEIDGTKTRSWRWVWLSPFATMALLRGPTILFVAIVEAFALITNVFIVIPLAYTLGPSYGITNTALLGACALPSGLGSSLGAPIAGFLSDRAVINGRRRRHGKWVPEDRLMATLFGGLLLVPLSVLAFGLTAGFLAGTQGLVLCLLFLFVNAMGTVIVLSPCAAYDVDIINTRSAEVIAITSSFRLAVCAIASAVVLPMINALGLSVTYGVAAALAWLTYCLLLITIRYGDRLRAWVDLGYTVS